MPLVVFHDPYLDVLGGGEKYLLTILDSVAREPDNDIQLVSPRTPEPRRWRRLNLDVGLERFHWRGGGPATATRASRQADLFVALTNDCPPLSLARRSVAVVQYPFVDVRSGHGWWAALRRPDRIYRLRSYDQLVCYSSFVAGAVRERLGGPEPIVLHPPVDLAAPADRACPKEAIVLGVGRFFASHDANNKKHEILVEAWRRLSRRKEAMGWELHLAGGLAPDRSARAHLERLRELADGLPVHFHPNAEFDVLRDLYRRSRLFWHATGLGETKPERYEHFGITVVEAMTFGSVPVVIGLGGPTEIVRDGLDGHLWHEIDQLVAISARLMGDPAERDRLAAEAQRRAERFGKPAFLGRLRELILAPAGVKA
jgi:glycosyltransferase involved in cell wall biosynthesis